MMFASSNLYSNRIVTKTQRETKNEWKRSCGGSSTMYRVSYVHVADCTPQSNRKGEIVLLQKKLSAVKKHAIQIIR